MNTLKSLCIATIAAFTLFLGTVLPASADPFDQSHQRCETSETLQCAVLQSHVTKIYTVGDIFFANTRRPFSDLLELNGWEEGEVTPDTIVPKGKKFAIRGSI